MEFYIRLIWEFQSVVEARMEEVPNEKGVRAFSLFPVSTSFVNAHIVINGSTLAGFYSRILDRGEGNVLDDWDMPGLSISATSFQQHRWTAMRKAFDIDRFETRTPDCSLSKTEFQQLSVEEKYRHASHLFANEIKTDGYSASVLYFCPKRDVQERAEGDPVVPTDYSPDVVIGLDPGMWAAAMNAESVAGNRVSLRGVERMVTTSDGVSTKIAHSMLIKGDTTTLLRFLPSATMRTFNLHPRMRALQVKGQDFLAEIQPPVTVDMVSTDGLLRVRMLTPADYGEGTPTSWQKYAEEECSIGFDRYSQLPFYLSVWVAKRKGTARLMLFSDHY
ncbi:hypothetical protein BBJ28_00025257, partial [Nothophytophthora sp. Chile5]